MRFSFKYLLLAFLLIAGLEVLGQPGLPLEYRAEKPEWSLPAFWAPVLDSLPTQSVEKVPVLAQLFTQPLPAAYNFDHLGFLLSTGGTFGEKIPFAHQSPTGRSGLYRMARIWENATLLSRCSPIVSA